MIHEAMTLFVEIKRLKKKGLKKMKNNIPIFSNRMAGYLMYHDCLLKDLAPNHNDPNRYVFFFERTPEMHRLKDEYLKMIEKQRSEKSEDAYGNKEKMDITVNQR